MTATLTRALDPLIRSGNAKNRKQSGDLFTATLRTDNLLLIRSVQ